MEAEALSLLANALSSLTGKTCLSILWRKYTFDSSHINVEFID